MASTLKEFPTRVFVLAAPMGPRFEIRYYTSARQLAQGVVDGHGQGLDQLTRQLVTGRAYVLTDGTTPAADLSDLCLGVYEQTAASYSKDADRAAVESLTAAIAARVG